MGLGSKIRDYIHVVGWESLFECKDDVYVELWLDFFSSFSVQKEALGKELDLVAIEAVQFRLCGMWSKMSLSQFGALLGFVESNCEPSVCEFPTEWSIEVAYQKLAGGKLYTPLRPTNSVTHPYVLSIACSRLIFREKAMMPVNVQKLRFSSCNVWSRDVGCIKGIG